MYITEYNFKKMIRKIDPSTLDLNTKLFKNEISFLSKKEVQQLKIAKLISEDPGILRDIAYQFVNEDSLFLNGVTPAYHKHRNCERLNSSFEAIPIPQSLINSGRKAEVKKWFNKNKHLHSSENFERLVMRFQLKFGITITREIYDNSGSVEIINDSVQDLVEMIKDLLKRSEQFGANSEEQQIIRALGPIHYITKKQNFQSTHYKTETVVRVINEFNEDIRYPLIKLITKYFIMKYNSNLTYSSTILDQLGFVPCRCCNTYFQ